MPSRASIPPLAPSLPPWRYVAGAWAAYGIVYAVLWTAATSAPLHEVRWVAPTALIVAATWAVLTPLIFQWGRVIRPSRIGWIASVSGHLIGATLCATVVQALRRWSIATFSGYSADPFIPSLLYWVDVWFLVYFTLVVIGHALHLRRRYVDRSVRAHLLEAQLARAQLQFLEIQLQPHFLFNALNAIQELAHEAPEAAERMLRRLKALLSISLERSGRDEVTLAEELAALEPYLDIQRTRFSDWLAVDVSVPDELRAALVPHLILQPLVENAIRHGLSVRPGPGRIDVRASRDGDRLLLTVEDDGVGLRRARRAEREGIGLRNASERLRQLYGNAHRFELREGSAGGVVVELALPFKLGAPYEGMSGSDGMRVRTQETLTLEEIHGWRTGEYATAAFPIEEAPPPRPEEAPAPEWQPSGSFRAARRPDGEPAAAPSGTAVADVSDPPPAALSTTGDFVAPGDAAPGESPSISMRAWLGMAALWLALAVFWTNQMLLFRSASPARQMDTSILAIARLQLATSVIWLFLSPLVFSLARRFRIDAITWRRHLPVHVAAALASGFVHTGLMRVTGLSEIPVLSQWNLNPLTGDFFVYFGLIAWSHSRDFVAWFRARELEGARLTSRIALSHFQSLRVQLRPQFLLSTLDLLAELVHRDVPRAERLITRLADTLRLTLDLGRESTTTIGQELALLQACVEAHRTGIRPGVDLVMQVPAESLALRIPSRLLCTMADELLAADAHHPSAPLTVRVSVERVHDTTRIRLQGDGVWPATRAEPHAWWRAKSVAEAAVADAGALVSLTFPDRATAVLIVADGIPDGADTPPFPAQLAGTGA